MLFALALITPSNAQDIVRKAKQDKVEHEEKMRQLYLASLLQVTKDLKECDDDQLRQILLDEKARCIKNLQPKPT